MQRFQMTPGQGLVLVCTLAAFTASLRSAFVSGDIAGSIVQQVGREEFRELLLPVFVAVPSGLASRRTFSSRRDIALQPGGPPPSYGIHWPRIFFRKGQSRDGSKALSPQQKLDIGSGLLSTPGRASSRSSSINVVLPGAIIVDPRHGILLPQGYSREELEPTIRESFRVMDRYLHRNESKLRIIKARRRRSIEQPRSAHGNQQSGRPVSKAGRRVRSRRQGHYTPSGSRRRRPLRHRVINTPQESHFQAERSAMTSPEDRWYQPDLLQPVPHSPVKNSSTEIIGTGSTPLPDLSADVQHKQSTPISPLGTALKKRYHQQLPQESPVQAPMAVSPRIHPELHKFLLEGTVNNTPADVFVLKDAVNTSSLHPFELVRLNTTNMSDPYEGTPLSSIGKYWLLPPGFKTRRRRRSLEPYYAVNSFLLSPTYTPDKNQTYYTVFFRVSDAVLEDFKTKNGQHKEMHDENNGKHLYSAELFNFVTNNTGRHSGEHKEQNEQRMKDLREHGLEQMFHRVYEKMKKDDERRYGTVEPPLAHHVTYSLYHEESGNGGNRTGSGLQDVMLKGPLVRRHESSEINIVAQPEAAGQDHHSTEANHAHTHPPEPIEGGPDNIPLSGSSALAGPSVAEAAVDVSEGTAPVEMSLEYNRQQLTPEAVQKLAEERYIITPEEPQKREPLMQQPTHLKDETNYGSVLSVPEGQEGKRTVSVNGVPYVLVGDPEPLRSKEDTSGETKTTENALPEEVDNEAQVAELLSSNAFAHLGMIYRPLNGEKVDSDILDLLRPEALIVPDPAKIQHDHLSEYPLAVVYRVPKQRLSRSPARQLPGKTSRLRPGAYHDATQGRLSVHDDQPLWQMSGRKGNPSSTTKGNIKCIYRKNSVVCYETS